MPVGGTAFQGQNQSPRLTTNYLNQLTRQGDPAPGVPVSTAQVSGSIVQPYSGMEGGVLTITNPWAPQFADPAVGPVYGGLYQYVQFNPTDTVAAVRGAICFWLDEVNYVVTTEGTGTTKIAGIIINPDLPGNWDFIQISGIAIVRFSSAGVVLDTVSVGPIAAGIPAEAVAGAPIDEDYLGIAVLSNPVASAVSPVELNILAGRNY